MLKHRAHALPPDRIAGDIFTLRGEKVLLDSTLAALYGVSSKRLNEQVRRNAARFPEDFVFQLTDQEVGRLRSQIATSNMTSSRGGRRYRPDAFTEHGALMAASVLNTPLAITVSVYVIRAFVRLREALAAHKDLARILDDLERRTEALAHGQDALAKSTADQFKQVVAALRLLMAPAEPKKRPIGFVQQEKSR